MSVLLGKAMERLLGFLPKPIFLGFVAILLLFGGFWLFTYRPELVPMDVLLDPWFIAGALIVTCLVVAYYVARYIRARPKKTRPGRVGIWLAQLEGDSRGAYLRDLKGQVEQELSPDPNLREVEISVYPRVLNSHEEAKEAGSKLNARGVVWGNLGKGLSGGRVSNLKLTVIGGPMSLQNDVQLRSEVDLGGYEMRDVAKFVTGYALLSAGKPTEAAIHFDRILDDPHPGLFELADALQFGGIASFLAANESEESRDLLEKAKQYFTEYKDLWSEDRDPVFRAMGLFNLGAVQARIPGASTENVNQQALSFYTEAGRLFAKVSHGEGYAMTKIATAHILSDLYQTHNEPAYGAAARRALEEAGRFVTKNSHPYRYAEMMFERGRLSVRMGYGVPAYFESAVTAFEEALEAYRAVGQPLSIALTILHWGGARIGVRGTNDEVRLEVLDAYRRASSIATKERFPRLYAEIQTSICAVLLDLPTTAPNLQAAVEAGEEALAIQTPEESDIEYARACINHAQACLAYSSLQEVPDHETVRHLEAALRSAEGALKVVGPDFYPNYYRHASELAEEAREKLADRGVNV